MNDIEFFRAPQKMNDKTAPDSGVKENEKEKKKKNEEKKQMNDKTAPDSGVNRLDQLSVLVRVRHSL